jgi:hypothetical protein
MPCKSGVRNIAGLITIESLASSGSEFSRGGRRRLHKRDTEPRTYLASSEGLYQCAGSSRSYYFGLIKAGCRLCRDRPVVWSKILRSRNATSRFSSRLPS